MRKLVFYVAVTLDGFIAGPDCDDPSGESYFPLDQDLVEFIAVEYPRRCRLRHAKRWASLAQVQSSTPCWRAGPFARLVSRPV